MSSRRFWFWVAPILVLIVAAVMHFYLLNSYPPGIDPDAAQDGLDALKPLRYNLWPFYITINSNPDPVYIYSAALTTKLFGARAFSLRFASVVYGLVGLAAMYTCLRELGRGSFDSRFRVLIAIFAVGALATSQPFAFHNRMALRFITQLPFQMIAIWALARAFRTPTTFKWALAGLAAALTQYTYPAARLLPLLLLLVLVCKLVQERPPLRSLFGHLAIYSVAVFVGLLPQLIWYLEYPQTLLARAGQTSITQNPLYPQIGLWGVIGIKIGRYYEALNSYWAGQYNQIKEPLLAPFFWLLFLIGGLACVRYLRRWYVPLVLSGLVVMVLPDIVQGDRDWPHEFRLIGAYPFVGAVVGLGAASVWALFQRWTMFQHVMLAALIGSFMFTAAAQTNEFFSMDGNFGKMYWGGNTWLRRVDNSLGELVASDHQTYLLPLENYADTPVKYLVANRVSLIQSALDAQGNLKPDLQAGIASVRIFLPRGDDGELWAGDPTQWVLINEDQLYILPPLNAAEVQSLLPVQLDDQAVHGQRSNEPILIGNYVEASWNAWPLPALIRPEFETRACFQINLCLKGASYAAGQVQLGQPLTVQLFWQVSAPIQNDYVLFVHLLDRDSNSVTGLDDYPLKHAYRTYEWGTAETIVTTSTLAIPDNLQPGPYALEVGFYLPYDLRRIPTIDANGETTGDRALIPGLKLPRPTVNLPANAVQTQINFGDELALVGYRVEALPTEAQPLQLTLWWQGLNLASQNWTVFFHLTPLSDNTTLLGQLDRGLTDGTYPPKIWGVGEIVEDQIDIPVSGLMAGRYALWFGLYAPDTFERLPIVGSPNPIEDNRTRLLEITVP